jgi:putative endonuclease
MCSKTYVYILECADGSFYTGWTTDLDHRLAAHNSGKGARYTRSRRPVKLIYYEEFDGKDSRIEAQRREYAIKQLSRAEKEKLIFKAAGAQGNMRPSGSRP